MEFSFIDADTKEKIGIIDPILRDMMEGGLIQVSTGETFTKTSSIYT